MGCTSAFMLFFIFFGCLYPVASHFYIMHLNRKFLKKTGMQSLKVNPDYEHLIEARVVAALESDKVFFKRINFKANLCIGLLVLKLLVDVGGATYFFN